MSRPIQGLNVAVVGATGVVGQEMFRVLKQRKFPVARLKALASERSAGSDVRWNGTTVPVEAISEHSFEAVDLALFSAGAGVSLAYAPIAAEAGAPLGGHSPPLRMKEDVPPVVPQGQPGGIRDSQST